MERKYLIPLCVQDVRGLQPVGVFFEFVGLFYHKIAIKSDGGCWHYILIPTRSAALTHLTEMENEESQLEQFPTKLEDQVMTKYK